MDTEHPWSHYITVVIVMYYFWVWLSVDLPFLGSFGVAKRNK